MKEVGDTYLISTLFEIRRVLGFPVQQLVRGQGLRTLGGRSVLIKLGPGVWAKLLLYFFHVKRHNLQTLIRTQER